MYDEVISVEVGTGNDKKKFGVHRGLICHHSSYFKAALLGDFKEAHEKHVALPEDDPEVFRVVFTWLYTRRLVGEKEADIEGWNAYSLKFTKLCKAWVFGDARGMSEFQNAVMLELISDSAYKDDYHDAKAITWAYEHTTPGAPLRIFLADYPNTWPDSCLESYLTSEDRESPFHRDFLYDLLLSQLHRDGNVRREKDWKDADLSEYFLPIAGQDEE